MNFEKIKSLNLSSSLSAAMKVILTISLLAPVLLWVKHLEVINLDSRALNSRSPSKSSNLGKTNRPHSRGIDVSHYQGVINWGKVARSDISFAYVKATGGETFTDPQFHNNWNLIRTTKIYRGAYHFFFAHDDPKKQADHFLSTIGDLREQDLPPMLDVEISDHESQKNIEKRALI
ncbi:hypothetical protein A9Q81_12945 [Gammaproteobacteria bacterium 42_54_T18]|nr:hypothetical protein A9Q81_12945 [Gammaproteobacteria bacterium 42_54_T18]